MFFTFSDALCLVVFGAGGSWNGGGCRRLVFCSWWENSEKISGNFVRGVDTGEILR